MAKNKPTNWQGLFYFTITKYMFGEDIKKL